MAVDRLRLTTPTLVALVSLAILLAGCGGERPTFGGSQAKAQRLVRAQFQLTRARFSQTSPGRDPADVCGLVSADSAHGRIEDVAYVANGDTDYAVLDNQALSFGGTRSVAQAASADCMFPKIWKALCRKAPPAAVVSQQDRCAH